MKLTIFGATGAIGRMVTDQALAAGHEVTAHARTPEKAGPPRPGLRVVAGDVRDAGAVRRAVEGADAVVCTLGMPLFDRSGLRAEGTRAIVRAMQQAGVRRLVCLSSFGAGDSRAALPPLYRWLIGPLIFRRLFAEHERQEAEVTGSGLDWTIVRPASYTDGPRTGAFKHGFEAGERVAVKISRADVAGFLFDQLSSKTYLRRAPAISY